MLSEHGKRRQPSTTDTRSLATPSPPKLNQTTHLDHANEDPKRREVPDVLYRGKGEVACCAGSSACAGVVDVCSSNPSRVFCRQPLAPKS